MKCKTIILLTDRYLNDYLELQDYNIIVITASKPTSLYNNEQLSHIETVSIAHPSIVEDTHADNVAMLERLISEILKRDNVARSQVRIIADCEQHILMAGALRERLNIPGLSWQESQLFHDKVLMKQHFQAHQIKVPHYVTLDPQVSDIPGYFEYLQDELGHPFIIKPKNQSGGTHFFKITSLADFNIAYAQASKGEFLAEEFIDGRLFQCDSINRKGEPVVSYCSQLFFSPDKFCKGETAFCLPIHPGSSIASRIMTFNQQIVPTLGQFDGVTHLEFFVDKTGQFYPIEIAARCPGAGVVGCYKKNFETNLRMLNCEALFGNWQFVKQSQTKPSKPLTRSFLAVFPKKGSGIVEQIVHPTMGSEYKLNSHIKKGDLIKTHSEQISDCIASMMVENTNYEYLIKDMNYLRYFDLIDYS